MPDMAEVRDLMKKNSYSGEVGSVDIEVELEESLKQLMHCDQAVAVSSSTFGLMLALASMNFASGREVIVPSFAFGSTIQAIYWNRLTPTFVDCLPGTLTIDPDEIVKAITPQTVAVIPVSVFGLPPDIEALEHISLKYDVQVIFDSSQGLGSMWRGRPIGGFGRCVVLSFNSEMVVTAGEGGGVVTNDSNLADTVRAMRQGDDTANGQDSLPNGLSSRMGQFNAAIGLLNLRRADSLVNMRLRLIDRYRERLERVPGCHFQQMVPDRTSNGTYFTIFISEETGTNRDQVFDGLKKRGIESRRMFFPPAHAHQAFRARPMRIVGDLGNTRIASSTSLALPLYCHMTDETVDLVCEAVESSLGGSV